MANSTIPAKTVRVIAFDAELHRRNNTRVVNISTAASSRSDKNNHVPKTHSQASGAPVAGEYPTVMASGAADVIVPGLPTLFISGYSGPS